MPVSLALPAQEHLRIKSDSARIVLDADKLLYLSHPLNGCTVVPQQTPL